MNRPQFLLHVAVQQEHTDCRLLNQGMRAIRNELMVLPQGASRGRLLGRLRKCNKAIDALNGIHETRQRHALQRLGLDI